MRKAKRPRAHHARTVGEQTGDAVDLGDVECFAKCHRWKNRRQTSREHRLTATGRADEEQIVSARRSDLERALSRELTTTGRSRRSRSLDLCRRKRELGLHLALVGSVGGSLELLVGVGYRCRLITGTTELLLGRQELGRLLGQPLDR